MANRLTIVALETYLVATPPYVARQMVAWAFTASRKVSSNAATLYVIMIARVTGRVGISTASARYGGREVTSRELRDFKCSTRRERDRVKWNWNWCTRVVR